MVTKEQRLILNSKGYDLVFERNGKLFAIKSNSIVNWDAKKIRKFYHESGLSVASMGNTAALYDKNDYEFNGICLLYTGDNERPEQPINCKDYCSMFYRYERDTLDLTHWDMSGALSVNAMFEYCCDLVSLNLAGWDVSNVTDFSYMFTSCTNLLRLNLTGWKLNKDATYSCMLSGTAIAQTTGKHGGELLKILTQGYWL